MNHLSPKRFSENKLSRSRTNTADKIDTKIQYDNIFRCCTSALLLLRLICPAIINPSDWNVFRSNDNKNNINTTISNRKRIPGDSNTMFTSSGSMDSSSSISMSPAFLSPLAGIIKSQSEKSVMSISSTNTSIDKSAAAMVLIAHTLIEGSSYLLAGKSTNTNTSSILQWGGHEQELHALILASEAIVDLIPINKVIYIA